MTEAEANAIVYGIPAAVGAVALALLVVKGAVDARRVKAENARRESAWRAECADAKRRGLPPPCPPFMLVLR